MSQNIRYPEQAINKSINRIKAEGNEFSEQAETSYNQNTNISRMLSLYQNTNIRGDTKKTAPYTTKTVKTTNSTFSGTTGIAFFRSKQDTDSL